MAKWLKRSIWLVLVFAVVWLAVIIDWQSTKRLPSEWDLLLYFLLLPLGIYGVGWVLYKIFKAPKAAPSAPAADPNASAQERAAAAQQAQQQQERAWTLQLLASALHTSAGASAAEVLAKLQEGPVAAELDKELKNPQGFPVFASRIAELDAAPTQEALAQWQAAHGRAEVQWQEGQLRALHVAGLAVQELAPLLVQHPDVVNYAAAQAQGRHVREDVVVPLRLIFLWPLEWSALQRDTASAWAASLVAQAGWPASRLVVQAADPQRQDAVAVLDYVTVTSQRAKLPTVGMLVACDSTIDQEVVDAWDAAGTLFGPKNANGRRPGEMAAGLLFADKAHAALLGLDSVALLHRASWANRDKSADERGRVSGELLASLVPLALETAGVAAKDVKAFAVDADHRTSREAELAEVVHACFPEAELSKDVLKLPQVCGSVQHMATVAALCVAHQAVVDTQSPVLCMSVQDPLMRSAVVLGVPAQAGATV